MKRKLEKAKPAEFVQEKKDLIKRLLNGKNINWIIEMGAAKRLFQYYPNPEFWNQLIIPFEIDSITALCSQWGKNFLKEQYNLFLYLKENHIPGMIKLEDKKLGENIPIKTKPKTVKDFLK